MNYIATDVPKSTKLLMRRGAALIVATTVAVGGIAAYSLRQFSLSQPEEITETVMPEIKTVTALGHLEPSGEIIQVSAPSSSESNRIEELLVKEGDEVEKGEVIAILDSRSRLQASLKQAEERVRLAEAKLAQVRAGAKTGEIEAQRATIAQIQAERNNDIAAQAAMVSRMEAEFKNAQVEYQRYEKLYAEGAISASERDSKALGLETAKRQLEETKANLERTSSAKEQQINAARATLNRIAEVRPVDVEVAAAEVREAQAAVVIAQAELDRAYIKAPQAGRVLKISTRPGEVISSDEGIFRVGKTSQMYAVAEIYESDIAKVKLGQKATITSRAIAEELHGTVENIGLEVQRQEIVNTDPTANLDAKVVEVKIRLDEQSSEKVAGFTNLSVTVQIKL